MISMIFLSLYLVFPHQSSLLLNLDDFLFLQFLLFFFDLFL